MKMVTETFGIQSLGLGYFQVFVNVNSNLFTKLPDGKPMKHACHWGSKWSDCHTFINYCLTGRKHWYLKEGYEACVNNCLPPMDLEQEFFHLHGDTILSHCYI